MTIKFRVFVELNLVEHYGALSEKYLAEWLKLLKEGDLVQASEKL